MDQQYNDLKVLFPVWELEPFLKVGGLGELARSLPRALQKEGVDIRVVLPYYQAIKLHGQKRRYIGKVRVLYNKKLIIAKVFKVHFIHRSIPVYLLQHRFLSTVTTETFGVFCLAITECLQKGMFEFDPSLIHCNDHHTALLPLFIKLHDLPYKTVLTIHSMYSQTRQSKKMATKLGIPYAYCHFLDWEIAKNQFNFLLEGILYADIVNTVSPTYAKEVLTEPEGRDLEEYLNQINDQGKFVAIINGIDYELKNPMTNPKLKHHYDSSTVSQGKKRNKLLLQRRLKLTLDPSIPLVSFIGRFSREQKGIDSLHKMIVRWGNTPCQFVIMGQGEALWEERFRSLAAFRPKSVSAITTYNDDLSPIIYAASDFVVVPSIFEPCGQVQMNAMRYGAIPIVRETGGLSDTVRDGLNGFVYTSKFSAGLEEAVLRALDVYSNVPTMFSALRMQALDTDNSWEASAKDYILIYRNLLSGKMLEHNMDKITFLSRGSLK